MALYFLHLRDGTDIALDEEGKDFADGDSLRAFVLMSARDLISADARQGVIDLHLRIDAEDADGKLVYSLPFKHSLSIIPSEEG